MRSEVVETGGSWGVPEVLWRPWGVLGVLGALEVIGDSDPGGHGVSGRLGASRGAQGASCGVLGAFGVGGGAIWGCGTTLASRVRWYAAALELIFADGLAEWGVGQNNYLIIGGTFGVPAG